MNIKILFIVLIVLIIIAAIIAFILTMTAINVNAGKLKDPITKIKNDEEQMEFVRNSNKR